MFRVARAFREASLYQKACLLQRRINPDFQHPENKPCLKEDEQDKLSEQMLAMQREMEAEVRSRLKGLGFATDR